MKSLSFIILFISLFGCKKKGEIDSLIVPQTEEVTEFVDGKGVTLALNSKGVITSAQFPDSLKTIGYEDYLRDYLKVSTDDSFVKVIEKQRNPGFTDDHYDQYYKGVKVDKAGYNFHFKNGKLYFANGNYLKISGLDVTPRISSSQAKDLFAAFKKIPVSEVSGFISEFFVKDISAMGKKNGANHLVFRIYLNSANWANNEVGYVDARTGKVLMTEPSYTNLTGAEQN